VSKSFPLAARPAELDGPAREALDLLHRLVAALKIVPHVAVHSIDRHGVVQFWNDSAAHLYGIPCSEAIGRPLASLASHGDEQGAYEQTIAAIWHSAQPAIPRDWPLLLRDGRTRWVYCSHFPVLHDGQASQVFCMAIDITERARSEQKSRHLAEHDFLTDLPNRVLFLDRLQQALAAARRRHGKLAVMFIDLDRFKGINDSFGHQVGDLVLKEVAQRLTRCVRSVDTVTRQGGDEFVVILADIGGIDQAAHVAGTVMHAVAQPVSWGSYSISLSVSIGIAIWPGDGDDVDTLLQHADVAMYHAKQNGRNAMSFFSPAMNAHVVERVQLERSLRSALANHEFELAWQPEIDIASGRASAVEALIRWRHPELGLLLPERFIGVAEEAGLMVPIGDWVLRTACMQAKAWVDAGVPLTVAVNLSQLQFIHNDLLKSVDEALAASGLAAALLDLEITETIITKGDERTVAMLAALRERGVQLTIDDFGTGSSCLGSLRRFKLSKLKIDRAFVGEIEHQPLNAEIIPAIIAVARSLRLKVVAEGVETAAQLRFLREHGCDEYQGHLDSPASFHPDLTPRRH
jgi:diguanylate cyclase (GGDEF)-like protein/PAS domain S-box-containing protein